MGDKRRKMQVTLEVLKINSLDLIKPEGNGINESTGNKKFKGGWSFYFVRLWENISSKPNISATDWTPCFSPMNHFPHKQVSNLSFHPYCSDVMSDSESGTNKTVIQCSLSSLKGQEKCEFSAKTWHFILLFEFQNKLENHILKTSFLRVPNQSVTSECDWMQQLCLLWFRLLAINISTLQRKHSLNKWHFITPEPGAVIDEISETSILDSFK